MATNSLTAQGLTIMQQPDIVSALTNGTDGAPGFVSIYGADINLQPNTPDGQMINIFATAQEDNLELLQSVYNIFSVPNAYGVQLDNIGTVIGIQRQDGTHTVAQVAVTVTQALTLPGQDVLADNPGATVFSVSDLAGNQYQLKTSYSFSGSGTQTLSFAAVDIGQILTTANTITVIATPLLGVSGVNNPSTAEDDIGTNEEADSAYRVRMAQSFQLAATGPADAMRAQLMNLPGVTDALVAENDTASEVDGVPAYGVWVVVNSPGATPAQIAQVIYSTKTLGCAQKTAAGQSYSVNRPGGGVFTAYWDNAEQEQLYISFTVNPLNGVDTFNTDTLASQLAAALPYKLNQSAFVGQIVTAMNAIAPNAYLTNIYVGTTASPSEQQVTPSSYQNYFYVEAGNIVIST